MDALEDLEKRGDVHFIADTCSHQPSFLNLNKLKEAAIWDKSLLMGKYVSWWWGICWKMGGMEIKRERQIRKNQIARKKVQLEPVHLASPRYLRYALGKKRRNLEKITGFGPLPRLFLSLNCYRGVFLLQLFVIFSIKIFELFFGNRIIDQEEAGGRWLQPQNTVIADHYTLNKSPESNFWFFSQGFTKYLLLNGCKTTK